MWQRVQTLYLVAVAVMFITILLSPIVTFTNGIDVFQLNNQGIISSEGEMIVSTFMLTIMEVVIALIALVTIFLFKKRMLQIRLSIFNVVLMVGFYVLLAVYIYVGSKSDLEFQLSYPVVFPLVSAILTYLAIRAIGKDEAMVRSFDRIR